MSSLGPTESIHNRIHRNVNDGASGVGFRLLQKADFNVIPSSDPSAGVALPDIAISQVIDQV